MRWDGRACRGWHVHKHSEGRSSPSHGEWQSKAFQAGATDRCMRFGWRILPATRPAGGERAPRVRMRLVQLERSQAGEAFVHGASARAIDDLQAQGVLRCEVRNDDFYHVVQDRCDAPSAGATGAHVARCVCVGQLARKRRFDGSEPRAACNL